MGLIVCLILRGNIESLGDLLVVLMIMLVLVIVLILWGVFGVCLFLYFRKLPVRIQPFLLRVPGGFRLHAWDHGIQFREPDRLRLSGEMISPELGVLGDLDGRVEPCVQEVLDYTAEQQLLGQRDQGQVDEVFANALCYRDIAPAVNVSRAVANGQGHARGENKAESNAGNVANAEVKIVAQVMQGADTDEDNESNVDSSDLEHRYSRPPIFNFHLDIGQHKGVEVDNDWNND
mmetsp:Transcript_2077/g.4026  ORF Transcript_2077/g.4026 Transcript_2077/m.4026 type:complete len:233 (+) Transcript_2077:558-1256(+)